MCEFVYAFPHFNLDDLGSSSYLRSVRYLGPFFVAIEIIGLKYFQYTSIYTILGGPLMAYKLSLLLSGFGTIGNDYY